MTENKTVWPSKLDENQIKDHSDIPAHHKTIEQVNKDVYAAPGDVTSTATQKATAEANPSNDAFNSHSDDLTPMPDASAATLESPNRPK